MKKVVATTLIVAMCVFCLDFSIGVNKVHSAVGLDSADILAVPVRSYTEAAEKFAHTGISSFGIPTAFTSLDYIMKLASKSIINQINNKLLVYVNTGGEDGNPLYVQNLDFYISGVGEKAGVDYITNANNNGTVCNYFRDSVNSGLIQDFNLDINPSDLGGGGCDIENEIGQEKLNVYLSGDFTGGGGWDTWTTLTQNPENNAIGAYLTNRDKMGSDIANKQAIAVEEARWGDGYLPKKDSEGNIITPGKTIGDQVSFTVTSDLRQLENVKTFDDVVTTLANSFIQKEIQNGLSGLNFSNLSDSSNDHVRPNYQSASQGTSADRAEPTNVAPQGTAYQSGNVGLSPFPHDASVALTGSRNRNPKQGGLSITAPNVNPWWEVDLGKQMPITKITVTPPIVGDEIENLTDFYIYVSTKEILPRTDIPEAGEVGNNTIWRSNLIKPANPNQAVSSVTLPDGTIGRWVKIQRISPNNQSIKLEIAGVEILAKSAPTITLFGANPMTIARGTAFVDPGASAVDENDGDLSSSIQKSGNVNTAVPGTYTRRYTVENSAGASITETRKVIVQ